MADAYATSLESDAADADQGTIRIVLADDHAVVRRGLRLLLDSEAGFEVVAEAGDVDSARRYVRGHHPAVLVLDLDMPGGSSIEAIPAIRAEFPLTQIVVLTMQAEPEYAREALLGGAVIALGHTNAEIAKQLFLSVRTIETHRAHIQQKLSLDSRSELVRYAFDRGLVPI